jgi:parvulin-like peptidyl-prolyl isomerase
VRALESPPPGAWSEPIHSALGWHLVRHLERYPEEPATFDEVKDRLRGVYVVERREEAVASFLQQGFAHYRVMLDGRRVTAIHPDGRVATRKASSGED